MPSFDFGCLNGEESVNILPGSLTSLG